MHDNKQIQIVPIAIFLIIFGAHVNILFIIKVKILSLKKLVIYVPANNIDHWV